MKKTILAVALVLSSVLVLNAQELTSKKGLPILPEKGDYALSIDAVPFFEYIGNMFHGTNYTPAPGFDFPGLGAIPVWTIQGKKMLTTNTAVRVRLRLGFSDNKLKNTILDQNNTSTTPAYVDDKWVESRTNIVLGAGIEKRRGKGRIQGLYGLMANLFYGTHGNKVVYGNEMNSEHVTPLSTVYPWVASGTGYATENANSRVLKDKEGLAFGAGVNAFIGVEYFFAPKMSLSGEFAWGFIFQIKGKSSVESEQFDGSSTVTTTYKSGGSTYFGFDNNNSGGALNLSFYF
jgi:hypothetical protein